MSRMGTAFDGARGMSDPAREGLRAAGAAACGAAIAAGYSIATGLAFNAHGRAWEMGAIPLLLAAFVFVGLLAGAIAGLGSRRHPYLAAFLASLLLFAIAVGLNELREALTPYMTRDERREFWANIEGLFFAGFPFGVPLALWGALITDEDPGRLRALRDGSYGLAGFIMFVASIPAAVHWLPWQVGLGAAAVAALAFVGWIARRNRRAGEASGTRATPRVA